MADDTPAVVGPVGTAVKADLEAMICTHPARDALTATALHIARQLDSGEADARGVAALAKELRGHLDDLAGRAAGDDDDLADLLGPELSAEVRDPEDP